jgi:hypothetical protein
MSDIVERIRKWRYVHGMGHVFADVASELMAEAVAEIERLRADRRWIPVRDKPATQSDTIVLGFNVGYGFPSIAEWKGEDLVWCFRPNIKSNKPTHWMTLPEPPKVT